MDYIEYGKIFEEKNKSLKEKGYDPESLATFKNSIAKATPTEADKLGMDIVILISKKSYVEDEANLNKIKDLILKGANLEVVGKKYGNTPLTKAAKEGLYKTFSLLVKAGANINAKSQPSQSDKKEIYNTTAVIWSSRKGFLEILDDLILLGADVNTACSDGDTALISAARHNQIESAKRLITANAILTIKNNNGETALSVAISLGYMEFAELIINNISKDNNSIPSISSTIFKELTSAKEQLMAYSDVLGVVIPQTQEEMNEEELDEEEINNSPMETMTIGNHDLIIDYSLIEKARNKRDNSGYTPKRR